MPRLEKLGICSSFGGDGGARVHDVAAKRSANEFAAIAVLTADGEVHGVQELLGHPEGDELTLLLCYGATFHWLGV